MRRREFIATNAAVLFATAFEGAREPRHIGFLTSTPPLTDPAANRLWAAFSEGVRDYGWVEGQNVLIEGRWRGTAAMRPGQW